MFHQSKNIFIVAGEPSGDLLAAALLTAIKAEQPQINLAGIGGPKLKKIIGSLFADMAVLTKVGVTEIIKDLPQILALQTKLQLHLLQHKPDALILVDAPAFNLRLAKWAVRQGIKVFYVVSPQFWAWKSKRIHLIKRVVQSMALLLPFEVDLYAAHDVPNVLVQHPLYVEAKQPVDTAVVRAQCSLQQQQPVLVLMPGSRIKELQRHAALMLQVAQRLQEQIAGLQVVCLRAESVPVDFYHNFLANDIKVVTNANHKLLSVATAALVASGTATLEVALHKVPMVTMYKTSPLTFAIAKLLVKVPYVSLCNWVLGAKVVPEFLQQQVQVEALVKAMTPLLVSGDAMRARQITALAEVESKFAAASTMQDLAREWLVQI